MTTKWHLESWRKIYVTKSPSWLRLPVSARGLGRELLTYADDAGRIDIGDDKPGVAIAYLLGARPKEHKRIAEDVQELLTEGYLRHDGQALVIRNFVEAQDRTPGAKRTAEWRAKKNAQATGTSQPPSPETSHVTHPVTSPSDISEPSQSDESVASIRSDPIRSEFGGVARTHASPPSKVDPVALAETIRLELAHPVFQFLRDRAAIEQAVEELTACAVMAGKPAELVGPALRQLASKARLGAWPINRIEGGLPKAIDFASPPRGIQREEQTLPTQNDIDPAIAARGHQKRTAQPPPRDL